MPHHPKPFFKKGRGVWYVEVNRKQVNLGPDRDTAFRRYHQLMGQPQARKVSAHSVLALIEAYLEWCQKHRAPDTYEWYRFRLERFARKYPDLSTRDLRPFHVQEWLDGMSVASGTKRNYCRAVKRCLRWARRQGYIEMNPIADLEQPRAGRRETVVSDAEFDEIIGLVPDRTFRDLLVVTWETGCRPQESLRVESRHVDLTNQRWVFPESESKGDVPRVVYLTDRALEITRRLMLASPTGPLFRNSNGKPWTTDAVNCAFIRIQTRMGMRSLNATVTDRPKDRRRKYVTVNDAQAAAFAKTLDPAKKSGEKKSESDLLQEARRKLAYRLAGEAAPKFSLYVLRHTWMNRLLKRGVDALTVAFLAGHSDPSTLAKFYAHLSKDPRYLLEQVKRAAG